MSRIECMKKIFAVSFTILMIITGLAAYIAASNNNPHLAEGVFWCIVGSIAVSFSIAEMFCPGDNE